MQKVLCNSQYTNPMVGEAQHFLNLVQAYDSAVNLFDTKTKFFFSEEELFHYHRQLAEEYLERFRAKFGPGTRLVLKCPGYSKFFPRVVKLLPDTQFVLIVRDTLDIVASQLEVGKKQLENSGTTDYPRDNIPFITARVNSIYFPILQNRSVFGDKLIIVKYENFVSKVSALERLSKLLNLPDLIDVARGYEAGLRNFESDSDEAHFSEYWAQDLTESRIGRHREILTPHEIETVKQTTRKFREMFGYD